MAITETQKEIMTAPVRENIQPYVNTYTYGSQISKTFTCEDNLKSITLERVGDESKFFGYGIVQKVNIKLINLTEAEIESWLTTSTRINIYNNDGTRFAFTPSFWISEVHVNAVTGEASVTAYDGLYAASSISVTTGWSAIDDAVNLTMQGMVDRAASVLYTGLTDIVKEELIAQGETDTIFMAYQLPKRRIAGTQTEYEFPTFTWNIDGTETYRELLDDIAEVYHAVYYLDSYNRIKFKQLIPADEPVLEITPDDYFSGTLKSSRRIGALYHTTVLGNNVGIVEANGRTGTEVYFRDNAILSLMDDETVLTYFKMILGSHFTYDYETPNLTPDLSYWGIGQFECTWRGNTFLEIGDFIRIYNADNDFWLGSYVLNDVIEYDGTLRQKTQWNYKSEDTASGDKPPTIAEVIKQTYAHVDKVNQNITQVVSTQGEHEEQITSLVTEAGNISASVVTMQNGLEETMEGINGTFDTLTKKVEAAVTADDVQISIERELSNGVDKVATKTGYTFDEEGLTIAKSTSEMSTQITDDGMTVYRSGEAVLIANNEGVQAEDLHATTYLIIGNNSRFEDMGSDRTACFWIGG